MDFIEAKHAAAREIALALGVPPMLLGIPGDNTYSNYQEAQRAFWRSTVLPLVARMTKAFSAWLSPAWGGRLELRADLDQVEGLSGEREALWARLNAATFLTVDEKRAAVGYGPAPRATFEVPAEAKYSPDQPRVPAGNEDGGQWTDGGGGGGGPPGRVRVAQADAGLRNDSGDETEVAQGRGARPRAGPRAGENWEVTPAQQMRLNNAENSARDRIRQVQRFDPEWRPRPSIVATAEGAIRRAEGDAREAESRLRELFRDAIPNTNPGWGVNRLKKELYSQGYVFQRPAAGAGEIYVNPQTQDIVRIMQRPSSRSRKDPAQKHIHDYYYRYRPAKGSWGAHITIPNKEDK
jgi:hypothetical protein